MFDKAYYFVFIIYLNGNQQLFFGKQLGKIEASLQIINVFILQILYVKLFIHFLLHIFLQFFQNATNLFISLRYPLIQQKTTLTMQSAGLPPTLSNLILDLASGKLQIIDMTHTLSQKFPVVVLPGQLGQSSKFQKHLISKYDEKGPAWYWNNFTCGEHTGTHLDIPVHWISGKDLENNTADTMPFKFIAPANVIDKSKEAQENNDFVLEVQHIKDWEEKYGEIQKDTWVLLRTDWYKRVHDQKLYLNKKEDGFSHFPGISKESCQYLIKKGVRGYGTQTCNLDAGLSFTWKHPLPAHDLFMGAGKLGVQNITNLDKLPPKGSVIFTAPLKIEGGSGSPLRVYAVTQNHNKN